MVFEAQANTALQGVLREIDGIQNMVTHNQDLDNLLATNAAARDAVKKMIKEAVLKEVLQTYERQAAVST